MNPSALAFTFSPKLQMPSSGSQTLTKQPFSISSQPLLPLPYPLLKTTTNFSDNSIDLNLSDIVSNIAKLEFQQNQFAKLVTREGEDRRIAVDKLKTIVENISSKQKQLDEKQEHLDDFIAEQRRTHAQQRTMDINSLAQLTEHQGRINEELKQLNQSILNTLTEENAKLKGRIIHLEEYIPLNQQFFEAFVAENQRLKERTFSLEQQIPSLEQKINLLQRQITDNLTEAVDRTLKIKKDLPKQIKEQIGSQLGLLQQNQAGNQPSRPSSSFANQFPNPLLDQSNRLISPRTSFTVGIQPSPLTSAKF